MSAPLAPPRALDDLLRTLVTRRVDLFHPLADGDAGGYVGARPASPGESTKRAITVLPLPAKMTQDLCGAKRIFEHPRKGKVD